MAQITKLVDDLDGTDAEMTLDFGLDGKSYSIDLSDPNYDKYREMLELLASKGREVVREPAKVKRTLSTGKKTGVKGKTQEMREWLRSQGHNVSDRGRVPQPLVDLYETRSRMPEKPVEAPKDDPKGEDTSEVVPDADKANEAAVIERVKSTGRGKRVSRKDAPVLAEVLSIKGDA